MKICPECGHIDRSHWRQNRWRTNVEFLKYLEQPEDIDSQILEKLKKGHPIVTDDLYAYRLSSGVVERIIKTDYEIGGKMAFHIPREKPLSMDPLQQTF
jgi:hypothetical protein